MENDNNDIGDSVSISSIKNTFRDYEKAMDNCK